VGSLCRLPRGSVGIFFVTSDVWWSLPIDGV
jgi:hypothetical protein